MPSFTTLSQPVVRAHHLALHHELLHPAGQRPHDQQVDPPAPQPRTPARCGRRRSPRAAGTPASSNCGHALLVRENGSASARSGGGRSPGTPPSATPRPGCRPRSRTRGGDSSSVSCATPRQFARQHFGVDRVGYPQRRVAGPATRGSRAYPTSRSVKACRCVPLSIGSITRRTRSLAQLVRQVVQVRHPVHDEFLRAPRRCHRRSPCASGLPVAPCS